MLKNPVNTAIQAVGNSDFPVVIFFNTEFLRLVRHLQQHTAPLRVKTYDQGDIIVFSTKNKYCMRSFAGRLGLILAMLDLLDLFWRFRTNKQKFIFFSISAYSQQTKL